MNISLIAAVSKNYVIGKDNKLIWRLPADMKYFKEVTEGHHVLMGRKNYFSIPIKFRPLTQRTNIVVTHNPENYREESKGCILVGSIAEGVEIAKKANENELFIIGGGEIYRQTINLADKLYITWIHAEFEGDAYFPEINFELWKETYREDCETDENHKFAYSFCIYEKHPKPEN